MKEYFIRNIYLKQKVYYLGEDGNLNSNNLQIVYKYYPVSTKLRKIPIICFVQDCSSIKRSINFRFSSNVFDFWRVTKEGIVMIINSIFFHNYIPKHCLHFQNKLQMRSIVLQMYQNLKPSHTIHTKFEFHSDRKLLFLYRHNHREYKNFITNSQK